jgi:hypothetical protein
LSTQLLATRKGPYHGRRRPCARLLEWVTAMIYDLDATGQISDLSEKFTLICQTYYGGLLGAYADPGADPAAPFVQPTHCRKNYGLYRFHHSLDQTSAIACLISNVAHASVRVFCSKNSLEKLAGKSQTGRRNDGPRAPRNPRYNDWLDKIFPGKCSFGSLDENLRRSHRTGSANKISDVIEIADIIKISSQLNQAKLLDGRSWQKISSGRPWTSSPVVSWIPT